MLPDFNRLRIFYYIYKEKSSTGAAKRLHITQSGVSQHLQKLEYELKSDLFTRSRRKLIPTAAGQKLFNTISPFIEELEIVVKNINDSETVPSGYLRLGFPVEFSKNYVPGILASFRAQYPDVNFFIKMGGPETLLPMVESGELDFAYIDIFPNATAMTGDLSPYVIEPMLEEELVLACSKAYYEKKIRGNCSFEQLSQLDYISYKLYPSALQTWYKFNFERFPVKLNIVLTIDSVQAVLEAIRCHMGLSVIVTHLVSEEINNGSIVPIKISSKKIINQIGLFKLRQKNLTLSEKIFQNYFRDEINKPKLIEKFGDFHKLKLL